MQNNTPPQSPEIEEDTAQEIDEEDIIEVISLNGDDDYFEDDLNEENEDIEVPSESAEGNQDMESENEDIPPEDIVDMAAVVNTQHKGSVFCCGFSPSSSAVATGGEDDMAYIWDSSTNNVIFKCIDHKDSVTYVEFSHEGTYLATGDMSGYVQVWKVLTKSKIFEFEAGELSWLHWHPSKSHLIGGTNEGQVWHWIVPQGDTNCLPNYGLSTSCGMFTYDGKRILVGYEDGTVRVFESDTCKQVFCIGEPHSGNDSAICMDCRKDNSLMVTGCTAGYASLISLHKGKVLTKLDCNRADTTSNSSEEEEVDHTVEAVGFCPSIKDLLVTATLAGGITVWDVSTQRARHHLNQGCGSSALSFLPHIPVMLTAGLDGKLRVYDVRSGQVNDTYTGHTKTILAVTVNRNGTQVLTSSDDGTARIFNLTKENT